MRYELDRADLTPLHVQAAALIRRSIAEGDAKAGDRLPPAADLASVMGVNKNTVLRALRDLRDEGLLEFRRGRGVTVCGAPERGVLTDRCLELLAYARSQGFGRQELIEVIEALR